MGDKKSTTREVWDFVDDIVGTSHYKTTISDGHRKTVGAGRTSEDAEKMASERWDKGKDDSACYLTTACVRAMELPDNCLELTTLRGFRDRILMPDSYGRKAVQEYYEIAPEIVQAVSRQSNAQGIWQDVYKDVSHAVFLVLSGDFEGAFKHYQQMTMGLKGKFLS